MFFDDTLLFTYTGTGFSGSDFVNSGLIAIHDLAGRSGRLRFSLNNVGAADSAFSIKGVSVVTTIAGVPEPTTWLTFIVGFGLSGSFIRRAGQQAHRTSSDRNL